MAKKILLTVLALLTGPVLVALTIPLVNWTTTGGLLTAAFVSFGAVKSVWKKVEADAKRLHH